MFKTWCTHTEGSEAGQAGGWAEIPSKERQVDKKKESMLNSGLDSQTMAGDLRHKAREESWAQTDGQKKRIGERGGGGRGGSDTRFGVRH